MVSWSFHHSLNNTACTSFYCPFFLYWTVGHWPLKTHSWFHSNLLLCHLLTFGLWVCHAQIKAIILRWLQEKKAVWEKETISWLSRSSSVVWTTVHGRKCWLGGEWVVYLTLSLWRSHRARKHVDGAPKTIAHRHTSYCGIHGSVKTTPSTGEMLHTSNKELFSGPVHDKNCQVHFGQH